MNVTPSTDSPAISITYVEVLLQMLTSKGITAEALLQNTAIEEPTLQNSEGFISYQQFKTLIENALQLSENSALGLDFGQQLNINSHGFLGYAIMSSASSLSALNIAMKYIKIRNRLISLKVFNDADQVILEFNTDLPNDAFKRFLIEHAFSSLHTIVQFLPASSFSIKAFHFDYPAPVYAKQYQAALQTPLVFSTAKSQVIFQAGDFNDSSLLADENLAKIAQQQCDAILAVIDQETDIVACIQKLLRQTPGQFPNAETMAMQIGLSVRTLSRQLKAESTSYKAIVDNIKQEMASDYLSNTCWSLDEIAYLLDYSDPSNFARAFKKWTGQSPRQYR